MIKDITVNEIIDTSYREFAMYTLEQRAIPSAIDGFKPVFRKLVYSMAKDHPTGKVKLAEIGGSLSSYNYHHGESSAMGAGVSLAAEYMNNAPVLEGHGSFGTRLVQEAAAPRYIFVSLSNNFKKYFIDEEVAPLNSDLDNPEPAHYLPVIPWVLVNGISGIAVGFKADILPRAPKDLIKAVTACITDREKYLKTNKIILPTFPQFRGIVEHVENNQYLTRGIIEYVGKYTYKISEVPVGHDRTSYLKILNDLYEADKIKDYEDNCSKDGFGFSVKVSISQKSIIDKDLIKFFKLEKTHTEILTTLGVDGKLKIFQSVSELVDYFVTYRMVKFGDKLVYERKVQTDKIKRLNHKKDFITAINTGVLNPSGMKKLALEAWITNNIDDSDEARKLAGLPLYSCTLDEVEKLQREIVSSYAILEVLLKTTPESRYRETLNCI